MDHSHHDHGMYMDDTPEARCKMWMLWYVGLSARSSRRKRPTILRNTQIIDTCVVFKWWHIRSTTGFVLSLIAIVLLGIFFEWLRSYAKRVDRKIASEQGKGRVRLGNSREGSRERSGGVPT